MSGKKIKVIQYGLGPIGMECARWLLKKPTFEIVGAIDIDPAKAGKPLENILGIKETTGVIVSGDAEKTLKTKADIVVHTTSSSLKAIYSQLESIIKSGKNIVSSTEELLVPYLQNEALAKKIDALAKKYKVTVLGTGVNPGFVMDALPLCLSSMSLEIKSLKINRVLDASKRRLPLQKKVGSGLTVKQFKDLRAEKKIGHVGLVESIDMLVKTLNLKADKIVETLDPVVAPKDIKTKYLEVKKGQVCGIKHIAKAMVGKKAVVSLDLRMYLGAEESFDLIEIDGVPPIKMKICGGVFGDFGTVSALINSIPKVVASEPGIKMMNELPLPYGVDVF